MDEQRFDAICRTMATGASRRRVLGGLAAAVAGVAGLRSVSSTAVAAPGDQVCGPLGSGKIDTTGDPQSVEICASGNLCITEYCVKAGSVNQDLGPVYVVVDPATPCVTITYPDGKAISHYSYSEGPCPEEPPTAGQWCSPGYWRQPQHLGSWAATGYATTDRYNTYFDPDLAGNPTLLEVLQTPRTYGGAAFNNVGDLLSEAHPEVDFTGERIEDSCPLGRNEG